MRSLASETSREQVRQYHSSHTTALNGYLDWYAVDFGGEPSALTSSLVVQQASFVANILRFLYEKHNTTLGDHSMLVMGYSMGGVVVEAALNILQKQQQKPLDVDVLNNIGLVISLAAPSHHVPAYMPPHAYSNLILPSYSSSSTRNSSMIDIPQLNILPGPSDYMVPALAAWHARSGKSGKDVTVDMDDIPGIWCSTHHKVRNSSNLLVF